MRRQRKGYAQAEREDEGPPGRPGGIGNQNTFGIGCQSSRVLVQECPIAARDTLINLNDSMSAEVRVSGSRGSRAVGLNRLTTGRYLPIITLGRHPGDGIIDKTEY